MSVAGHEIGLGIIAPYKTQVELLMNRRYNLGEHVDVKTVDGFQRGEKDVIMFSAVRANVWGNIGFVNNARRLNVALTRGRYILLLRGLPSPEICK